MLLNRFFAPIATAVLLYAPAALYAQTLPWALPSATERYARVNDAQVPYYDARRAAYDQGYREGVKEGEKDARRGDRYGYQDEREFQRADRGYNRHLGDRERYRQTFRDGYANGYSDSHNRYSRDGRNTGLGSDTGPYGVQSGQGPYAQRVPYGAYGGSTSGYYNSPAYDNGVREGFKKGQEDARKERSYDILRHEWYREGDRHYENRYGSRQQYKDVYRRGFQQGYEDGFRDWRYRR